MNVLFLLTNPVESPGERYRILQYLPRLAEAGIHTEVHTLLSSSEYQRLQRGENRVGVALAIVRAAVQRTLRLRRRSSVDLVVMYRQPIGLWPGAIESALTQQGVPFLFDFDDAIFLPSPSPVSRLSAYLRPPERLGRLIASAALITAGNDYLATYARSHSNRVEVLPTCVDTNVYRPRAREPRNRIVAGWIGSRSTAPYLHELDHAWKRLDERLHLRVIGGQYSHPDVDVDVREWALETEAAEVADLDIGLMPLPADRWTQGKCGLKILQYMASGVPTVASPVGVNTELISDGVNGFLASDAKEWAAKLQRLVDNEPLRRRFAEAGRATVLDRYALDRWAPRFAKMMQDAAL